MTEDQRGEAERDLELRDKTTSVQDTSSGGASATDRVSLVLYHRDGAKVVPLALGVPVVVGRAWPADAVVRDINLSRQHARFTWAEDGVWVEDLGSTNGTKLNGSAITERAHVGPDDELTLGAVTVSLHTLAPKDDSLHSADSHDRFQVRLEEEVVRARTFQRPVAVLMVRAIGREDAHVRHWLPKVKRLLRPVDAIGLYGPSSLVVALPEQTVDDAARVAKTIVESRGLGEPALVAGIAVYPSVGASAEELLEVVRAAARTATPAAPVQIAGAPGGTSVRPAAAEIGGWVVVDPRMKALHETVQRVARSQIPVLIHGETGTGKEVIARAIHELGPRKSAPMRSINCAAIPATLLESQLFGHEKGAFTGAERKHQGLFEQADGGTVFLDEVGELSAAAQAALLRVLETKRLTRVGSTDEIEVDVRIVAATHRNLEAMCQTGDFRWDLFYRLNTMILELPPLRDRVAEIAPLADRFLAEAARANGSPVHAIDAEAKLALERYAWPGNVRELRNVIERAVVIAEGETITVDDLSERVRGASLPASTAIPPMSGAGPSFDDESSGDFKARIRKYETDLILDALRRASGNQTEAAKILRMPLRTLVHKIAQYGIKKKFE